MEIMSAGSSTNIYDGLKHAALMLNASLAAAGSTGSAVGAALNVNVFKRNASVYYGADMRYPTRKLPEAGQLNGLIAFLLTPAAAPLNGSDLMADGAMTQYYTHRRKVEGRPYYDWPSS